MKWIKVYVRKVHLLGMEISSLGYVIGMRKLVGRPITGRLLIYRNKIFTGYDLAKDDGWLKKMILENYKKKNFNFFQKIINKFPALYKRLVKISNQIYNSSLKDLSNQELSQLFRKFRQVVASLMPYILIPRKIDVFLAPEVKNEFLDYLPMTLKTKGEDYFNLIVVPQLKTWARKEEAEIIKIALKFKKLRLKIIDFKTLKEKRPDLYDLIEEHCKKYNWLGVYFCGEGEPLDIGYYLSIIKDLIQKSDKELKSRLKEITTKQLLPELRLSKNLRTFLNIIKDFSILKVKTGELWSYSGFRFRQLLKEIANRADFTIEEAEYLLPEEVIDFLEAEKKLPSHDRIKRRMKLSVLMIKNREIGLYEGRKAQIVVKEELKEENEAETEEIKGQIAYSGKVRGEVKIVFGKEKIAKFKLGEILVTGMTSVDYVPAIKKAKAIITDEGGITCHAAVVAREFQIPTIIGTKIATQALKDGDLVEVDANIGIVRILK